MRCACTARVGKSKVCRDIFFSSLVKGKTKWQCRVFARKRSFKNCKAHARRLLRGPWVSPARNCACESCATNISSVSRTLTSCASALRLLRAAQRHSNSNARSSWTMLLPILPVLCDAATIATRWHTIRWAELAKLCRSLVQRSIDRWRACSEPRDLALHSNAENLPSDHAHGARRRLF